MLVVIALAIALVPACVAVQLAAARRLGRSLERHHRGPGDYLCMLEVVGGLMAAHAAQIVLYAAAFCAADRAVGIPSFGGANPAIGALGPGDYLYVSLGAFTSVGYGDLYPIATMRLLAAAENLNGMLMLGWSVSVLLHVRLGRNAR